MVEAFAMIAGTALEYGVKMLACLNVTLKKKKNQNFPHVHLVNICF